MQEPTSLVHAFTHANTKEKIYVALPLIFAAYFFDKGKCTHILSTGGAIIPVVEDAKVVLDLASHFHKKES